jgi:hypothetical protein
MSVEKRRPEINTDLGWILDEGITRGIAIDKKMRSPGSPVLWEGKVTLPEAAGAKKYRLVIKEFEVFYEDAPDPSHPGKFSDKPQATNRLVYAETFEL